MKIGWTASAVIVVMVLLLNAAIENTDGGPSAEKGRARVFARECSKYDTAGTCAEACRSFEGEARSACLAAARGG